MTRDITIKGCEENIANPGKHESQRSTDLVADNTKSPASSLDGSERAQKRNESAAATSPASSRQTDDSAPQRGSAASSLQEEVSPSLLVTEALEITRFDLDSTFGPASGIPRLERWERALKFGLLPPVSMRKTLLRIAEGEGELIKENR